MLRPIVSLATGRAVLLGQAAATNLQARSDFPAAGTFLHLSQLR